MKIKRTLLEDIINHLSAKEITLIIGPRQVGKTTIMKEVQKKCISEGKKTVFLNLDYENDAMYFTSQERLLQKLKLETGDSGGVIFIDEIQKKENAGIFLKGIYDLDLPYKFIISGSGSLELKEKIHESLAGRKRVFECYPVSFYEFMHYKTNYAYSNIVDFCTLESEKSLLLLEEYLSRGAYPRIITEFDQQEKLLLIDEIFKSYIIKDIAYLLKVEKTTAYTTLIKLIATQIGQISKYSEYAKQLGIAEQTVKLYLYYAVETFFIKQCLPYYTNKQKEITKSPMLYFNDLGMRNFALGINNNLKSLDGFQFQNFIFLLLEQYYKKSQATIKFWRTTDGAEVDLIIEKNNSILPVEIKYITMKKPDIPKGLKSIINTYQPKDIFVINLTLSAQVEYMGTMIHFKPYYEFLNHDYSNINKLIT